MPQSNRPRTQNARGRNTGLSERVFNLERENAIAVRERAQWQQLHAQAALALGEVRRIVAETPAEELPTRLRALLSSPAVTDGRDALRSEVIDALAEDFVNTKALALNRVDLHAWILSHK